MLCGVTASSSAVWFRNGLVICGVVECCVGKAVYRKVWLGEGKAKCCEVRARRGVVQ